MAGMNTRLLEKVVPSIPASDGAGVKLRRSLGSSPPRLGRGTADAPSHACALTKDILSGN